MPGGQKVERQPTLGGGGGDVDIHYVSHRKEDLLSHELPLALGMCCRSCEPRMLSRAAEGPLSQDECPRLTGEPGGKHQLP